MVWQAGITTLPLGGGYSSHLVTSLSEVLSLASIPGKLLVFVLSPLPGTPGLL